MKTENKILEIKNLSLYYTDKQILKNINFDIFEGEIILLSGSNGSGKSSIIYSIMRDFKIKPKNISGEIIYNDNNLLIQTDIQYFRRVVGYTRQTDIFSENTCLNQIMLSVKYSNNNKITKNEIIDIMQEYGLSNYINKNPNELSGGQKKLVSILATIVRAATSKIFIIDEPINNLDFNNSCLVSNMITKIHKDFPKISMLIVSHCHIFPIIDRVIKISDGTIENSNIKYDCHNCFGEIDSNGLYRVQN